jgi:glutamine amidotransferase
MISIINYNTGNLLSIKRMLKKVCELDVFITNDSELISQSSKIILPGVGHFDYGIQQLNNSGLIPLLNDLVFKKKIPILGICLGAQLMTRGSEEGLENGLGWVEAETVAFDRSRFPNSFKIPHMGWNDINIEKECSLFFDMPNQIRFYFVHGFHLLMDNYHDIWLTTEYGYRFCAAYQVKNIYACQFHPEKSHKFGMKLMENFANI